MCVMLITCLLTSILISIAKTWFRKEQNSFSMPWCTSIFWEWCRHTCAYLQGNTSLRPGLLLGWEFVPAPWGKNTPVPHDPCPDPKKIARIPVPGPQLASFGLWCEDLEVDFEYWRTNFSKTRSCYVYENKIVNRQ